MAETEQTVTANFRTNADMLCKFNAEVKLRSLFNKNVFNAFLAKFIENPKETLKFIGINN